MVAFFDTNRGRENLYFILKFGKATLLLSELAGKNIENAGSMDALLTYVNSKHAAGKVYMGCSHGQENSLLYFCLSEKYTGKHMLFYYKGEKETIFYLVLKSGHIFRFSFVSFDSDRFLQILLPVLFSLFQNDIPENDFERLHEVITIYEVVFSYRAGYAKEELTASRLGMLFNHRKETCRITIAADSYTMETALGRTRKFPRDKSIAMIRSMYDNYHMNAAFAPFPTKISFAGNPANVTIVTLIRFSGFVNSVKKIAYKLYKVVL